MLRVEAKTRFVSRRHAREQAVDPKRPRLLLELLEDQGSEAPTRVQRTEKGRDLRGPSKRGRRVVGVEEGKARDLTGPVDRRRDRGVAARYGEETIEELIGDGRSRGRRRSSIRT